jgi:hypothetical protein
MNITKLVSNWLRLAGEETPKVKKFPQKPNFCRWYSMMIEEVNEAVESADSEIIEECIGILSEKLEALKEFNKKYPNKRSNVHELRDSSADQKVVIANLDHMAGLVDTAEKDVCAVMDSNYSKFCLTEKEALDTCEAYEKGEHPNKMGVKMTDVDYRQVEGKSIYIVFSTENGKILKSINYEEPNF